MRGRERPIELTASQLAAFWRRVEKRSGCWKWKGFVHTTGYGVIGFSEPRQYRAHRISYTLANGQIPRGLTIDHLCRNRWCVNPKHLEAVTNRENILRGNSPTAANAIRRRCVRGHSLSGDTIRLYRGRRVCLLCEQAHNRNKTDG